MNLVGELHAEQCRLFYNTSIGQSEKSRKMAALRKRLARAERAIDREMGRA